MLVCVLLLMLSLSIMYACMCLTTDVVIKYHVCLYGRVHTGSGSVPDSSEPYASGRLRVGFAFTLLTADPTRTVRRLHTASTSRPVVTQLHAFNF